MFKKKIIINIVIIFCAVCNIFIPNSFAQQSGDIENCINELKDLQREFNLLLGQGKGPARFNPSVLDTNYNNYRRMPEWCYKHVNELNMYIAEGRARQEREATNQNLYKQPETYSPQNEYQEAIPEYQEAIPNESSFEGRCSPELIEKMIDNGIKAEMIEKLCR